MTTNEGNKLIAEFMGAKYGESGGWEFDKFASPYSNCGKKLRFYTSWDWLMPVVEKIESLAYRVAVTTYSATIEKVSKDEAPIIKFPTSKGDDFKKEALWLVIVEFIEWYNKQ